MASGTYKLKNSADFMSPIGRFNFAYLFGKAYRHKGKEDAKEQWACSIFWDFEDPVIAPFEQEVKNFFSSMRAYEKQWLENFKKENQRIIDPDMLPIIRVKSGLHGVAATEDGDKPAELRTNTGRNVEWPNDGRPQFYDRKGKAIAMEEAKDLIYTGSYGRITGRAHTSYYNDGVDLYVTYRPHGVQFFSEGDPMSAGGRNVEMTSLEAEAEEISGAVSAADGWTPSEDTTAPPDFPL